MKQIRLISFIIIVIITETTFAQGIKYKLRIADSEAPLNTVYIHFSGEFGDVLNADLQPLRNGIGGTFSFLIPDNLINKRNHNYFSMGIKGLNNPHPNMPYLSTMNIHGDKEIDNSFNFFQILAGYRFSDRIRNDGTYLEPRAGYILWDFHDNDDPSGTKGPNHAIVFSPTIGYVYKNFDFAVFSDLGISKRPTNIAKNVFFALGISIGYNLGFYDVNSCHCDPRDWQ
jgi:hypothetical protein